MIHHLRDLHTKILDIIAPPFCLSCKIFLIQDTVLCAACRVDIKPVISKSIVVTKERSMSVLAIGSYAQPLRSLILAKSRSNRAISCQLGKLVYELTYVAHADFDIIVPVPLHWTRYAWRGYNQAEVIAQEISRKTGKPVVQLLNRIKRTPYQSEVKGIERIKNVKDIFELGKDVRQYVHKKILLVDDLMTTGATLQSAAKKLVRLKPEKLTAVVAARVI